MTAVGCRVKFVVQSHTKFLLMKKRIIYLLPLALVLVQASCKKDKDNDTPSGPIITEKGTPLGSAVTQEIGSAGGQFQSADGLLTVTVPAGALNSNTTIGIQPISNRAPQGIGTGYRLTPEGTSFNVPVTISIRYSTDSLANTAPDFLWIVSQNEDRSWSGHRQSVVDANAKTVTVETTHFSDWVIGSFIEMSLSPSSAKVKVNKGIGLSIAGFDAAYDDGEVIPLAAVNQSTEKLASRTGYFTINGWSLNGANAPVSGSAGSLQAAAGGRSAQYTAPSSVPSQNPVAVSVSLTQNQINGPGASFMLVSNIQVYEGFFARFTVDGTETVFTEAEIFTGTDWPPTPNMVQAVGANGTLSILFRHITGDRMLTLSYEVPQVGSANFTSSDSQNGVGVSYFKLSSPSDQNALYQSQANQLITVDGSCESNGSRSSGTVNISAYTDENGALVAGTFSGTIWNLGNFQACTNNSIQLSGAFSLPLYKQ